MTDPFEEYPEFDVADWSRLDLNSIPPQRMIGFLESCLKYRDFRELMMHQYGSIVLGASKNLLTQAKELIGRLGMLDADMDDEKAKSKPDWKELKRQQRANHLRDYWEKLRKKQERMRELRKLYSRKGAVCQITGDLSFITGFVKPFSSKGDTARNWDGQLADLQKAGLSSLLPWRPILAHELASGKTTLSDITPIIENKKKDTALKFQFLLEMAHDQKITISQEKPFQEIEFSNIPNSERLGSHLTLKDRLGHTYTLDWVDLSAGQRQKVIDDLKEGKVMLV